MKVLALLAFFCVCNAVFAVDDPRCSGVPAGEEYAFPYPGDCTKFILCQETGQAEAEVCEDGFWFNEALQSCDHPDTSGCVPLTCPPGIVDYYSYPGDCTRYVECYRGSSEVHSCPTDLYFNADEKRCTSVEISNCGQYASTVEPTWTTPVHTACYGVRPGLIVLKPYSGDCNRYIECVGADATIKYCPSGLWLNEVRQLCDHPEVSGCDATTGSPDPGTTSNPNTVSPINDPRCANGNHEYWPDVECSRFVECYEGWGYIMECPSGLYFNEANDDCVNPSDSNCGRATVTANPHTTTPSELDPDCPWPTSERYLFPFPGDCTKFLECVTGVKVVQDCPESLYFNPDLLVCDYPYEAHCAYAKYMEEEI